MYVLVRTGNLLFLHFTGVSHYTMKSILNGQVTFDHSVSCVLLIDKPNEVCQNSKKFERNAISTTNQSF